jgi:hypothetical protein
MKAFINVLSLTVFVSVFSAHASDQTAAQKYPFSALDRELFFNFGTRKVESPFSTASVNTFSKDALVTIEEDDFNDLYKNGLKRSERIACENLQALRNTPQENYKARKPWQDAADAASESNKTFQTLRFEHHEQSKHVRLPQQTLVHLLQFSKAITVLYSTVGGSSAVVQVSLDQKTLTASKLLASFIVQAAEHVQQDQGWVWN